MVRLAQTSESMTYRKVPLKMLGITAAWIGSLGSPIIAISAMSHMKVMKMAKMTLLAVVLTVKEKMKYTITLEYQGKTYSFIDEFNDSPRGDPDHNAVYCYTEGNFGCDCNRSEYIIYYCAPDFPDMECGDTIKLISITREDGTPLLL